MIRKQNPSLRYVVTVVPAEDEACSGTREDHLRRNMASGRESSLKAGGEI